LGIFEEWQNGGTEIRWRSSTAANSGTEVSVFSRRCGTPGAPALVCVHGFPTSSIDYYGLTRELSDEFDIFVLDFPGYGLSDKPPAPYVYSLYDDARLLVDAITRVWKLGNYTLLTHDRGSSVGMIALGMLAAEDPLSLPDDVILTNANIFLPLANLTAFQTALLDNATGRSLAAATTPEALAAGLGASTFMPRERLMIPRLRHWRSASPITTESVCYPTRSSIFMSAPLMKPVGLKIFPRPMSTQRSCGACTTTSHPCGCPTTCGTRS
jgi:pimeloyl-ACP methyl ester carboxylesterase